MSYKLSLQIKNEFENDALAREIKEKEDRAQALLAPQHVGGWSNNNNHNNKPLDPKRFDDDPTKIDLHRKTPHHKGALSEELHDAAWREDLPLMQQMIQEDPSLLDECDSGGQNLLHLAAFWGSLVVCEQLIQLGIDCEAVNVHAQRPLDIAVQWGHVAVADVIRHAGGTSLFETKLRKVERHLMSLEDELTDARIQLKIERNKRIVMEEERDVARRVGNMAHTEWKKEFLNTILSQGSEQYLKTINARMSQKKNLLHNKYFKAITWGSHESNWRIHLQELLRQEQQRVKEKNECLKMGHEEIANSKVERKIATEIRDHALAEAKASKEARIVAETICKEAIKYMEQLRPYKMKYNQLLRRNGINGVTSSLSDLLRVVPKEVLAGAVQVLSDLSRATSTAQPGVVLQAVKPEKNKTKTVLAIEQDGGGANATKELTFEALKDLNKERQSEQEEEEEEDKVSAAGESGGSSSRRSGSSQSKKKKRKKRNAQRKKKKKLLLFDRMKIDGVKNDTNSQLASDMRRSKGEANRLGGLPSTPFDLLVLDPYGAGLEVLQCVHVSKDMQGYDRLRVMSRAPVNAKSDHFQRVDEKRQLDYEAKLAVKRARDRHAATSKKFRSLNRIGGGGSRHRPNTVEGSLRKMEPVVGGVSRRKQLYEVEQLWAAAFSPKKKKRGGGGGGGGGGGRNKDQPVLPQVHRSSASDLLLRGGTV